MSPGPGCSKLTTSLVNVLLKFSMLISLICQYFMLKNCEKLLQCKSFSHVFNKKNISVFGNKVVQHLMSLPLNKLLGRVAQSVGHLTHKSGVLGLIPGLAA